MTREQIAAHLSLETNLKVTWWISCYRIYHNGRVWFPLYRKADVRDLPLFPPGPATGPHGTKKNFPNSGRNRTDRYSHARYCRYNKGMTTTQPTNGNETMNVRMLLNRLEEEDVAMELAESEEARQRVASRRLRLLRLLGILA